ncbi:protein TOPLESS-like isoform X1 [Prunus yedoensis var. nudiflora]|uniref:Protein TOPLESS-like isoform X1 n=1 Tax=Prunus yedoensis var. nudiflora TaxID=2094558 RepID=A0A314UMD1_PRUYE|nr:protein TOPLESS-like isoform X1 [Prunus yedoensis var. nudiflora]
MRSCSKICITCVWVQSNKDHKALSMCGEDIMSMRKTMMKELRQIIEANPVFRGKLKYPSIKSLRLHNLINQSLNWQHKDPRPNPVIKTLFVDHVCEPQENVHLPLPIENNLEDCLSLSLSTGNSLQVRYVLPSQATSNPLPTSSAEPKFICNTRCALSGSSKSTVTDPGQSHVSTIAIPNGLPTTVALTLNEGSSPMSMDIHPTWQTILLC